ncbi:MAG: NADH-quinone oxidoreductase subunit C [Candidatus Caenarcaniphilales bacterium]|nr:NADH-quinone oxidoreductase subunit C [Candidatus Caenarcaniphilales bacterium]
MADLPVKPGDDKLAAFLARKEAIAAGKDPDEAEKAALAKFGIGVGAPEPAAEAAPAEAASTEESAEAEVVEEVPPPPPKTPEAKEFFDAAKFNVEELGEDAAGTLMYGVQVADLVQICKDLKSQRKFNVLNFMTAVEYKEGYKNIIRLESNKHLEAVVLKVTVSKDNPTLPTLTEIYPSANWQEREAYDMIGIIFEGHPNLTRILNPDDWEGYPLRKDYVGPLDGLNQPIKYAVAG